MTNPRSQFIQRQASRVNPDFKARNYNGPFKVYINSVDTEANTATLTINEGHMLMGSGILTLDETQLEIDLSGSSPLYVYAKCYSKELVGSETVVYEYVTSTNKPKIEKVTIDDERRYQYPILVAELTIINNSLLSKQIQYGNHNCSGCLS